MNDGRKLCPGSLKAPNGTEGTHGLCAGCAHWKALATVRGADPKARVIRRHYIGAFTLARIEGKS